MRSGLFSNIRLIAAVGAVVALQAVITYTRAFQSVFQTQSLSVGEFLFVGAASSIVFFAVEAEKALSRRKGKVD
ncbi:cation transporting ATPase C-terminal domain-containing protein [Flavobacterium arundinis]|uniref:cation transporting ATPase C-terminal domain-containing protein n=1 Tax=Flavobacterium arundinis TaxID=3139143 RepID=UPI0038B405D0